MPSTAAPFGFIPSWHPSGQMRPRALPGGISAAYANTILQYQPVLLATTGVLNEVTSAADFVGVFAGVEYTPTGGRPVVSKMWVGGTSFEAGSLTAYYYEDPLIQYRCQSAATLAATAVGDQADESNFTAGSTTTGLSAATLGTLVGAGVQGMWRIESLFPDVDNAWGDTYVNVLVSVARHQYVSNKVAI